MPAHRFSPPPQAQAQVTDPYYGDYSALAQQFLKTKNHPVYSAGQGIADALGDVGEAFFDKKALDKAQAQQKQDYSDAAMAQQIAGTPNPVAIPGGGVKSSAGPLGMNAGTLSDSGAGPYFETAGTPAASPQQVSQAAMASLAGNPRVALDQRPDIQAIAQQFAPKRFSGTLKEGEHGFVEGQDVANVPAKPMAQDVPLSPDVEAQRIRIANASRPPAAEKVPQTKFAFDRTSGKNRSVTPQEEAAEPDRYAPPISAPQTKLFNAAGQEIGTGDPNDPTVQARIASGEVRTAPPRQFSGEQSKAAGFANDAMTSEANVEKLMNPQPTAENPKPKKFNPAGNQGWSISNYTASPEYQQYQQAKANWGMAILRQESGGAITPEEGLAYAETFFPRFGDKQATIDQKKTQREEKVRGLVAASGGAYQANFGNKNDSAPSGVDPKIWAFMTPEERAHWAN